MQPRWISPTSRSAAVVLLVALLSVACDTTEAPPERDPTPTPPPSEIQVGGDVTFGVLGEPATLDPYADDASDLTYFLARPVYRSLFRVMPDGVVESDLVSRDDLRAVPGGVTAELQRARWSNGDPITARDVVRSVERARPPSGFVGLEATAIDRRTVRFRGNVSGDWARRLAVGTFIVPPGNPLRTAAGPFVMHRYVPGLEVTYHPNTSADLEPLLDRLTVRFVADLEILLKLLEAGELDAAAIPSAVNIDERLDELGLSSSGIPGWETIVLDLELAKPELRAPIIGSVDRELIAQGLIRDDGRALQTPVPESSGGVVEEFTLGTATGDELLVLIQRVIQKNLKQNDMDADLATIEPRTFYSDPRAGIDVSLRREIVPGFFGSRVPKDLSWFPLFSVHSFIAWNDGVGGFEPNGSLDGPLWNAHEWYRE